MAQIIPTTEPFLFPGNKTGVLLTHGFTGTPKEMRWMGEYLHAQGFTTLGMRLSGHATRPENMIRSRWQDWLLTVEDGYNLLRTCSERIFLVGLSMGGVLSLTFASQFPVAGVVAMSTPYALPDDWRLKIVKPMSYLMPYLPKGDGGPDQGWVGPEWKQHVSYPQNPVRSIGELNELLGVMRASLPYVKVPALIVHARQDDYVVRDSAEKILAALGSMDKQLLWIEGSGHVLTEEPPREVAFKAAADFIARVSVPA
jgi:carboxylesterase